MPVDSQSSELWCLGFSWNVSSSRTDRDFGFLSGYSHHTELCDAFNLVLGSSSHLFDLPEPSIPNGLKRGDCQEVVNIAEQPNQELHGIYNDYDFYPAGFSPFDFSISLAPQASSFREEAPTPGRGALQQSHFSRKGIGDVLLPSFGFSGSGPESASSRLALYCPKPLAWVSWRDRAVGCGPDFIRPLQDSQRWIPERSRYLQAK